MVSLLLKAQADPNVKSRLGESSLQTWCREGNTDVVTELLDCGAVCGTRDHNGADEMLLLVRHLKTIKDPAKLPQWARKQAETEAEDKKAQASIAALHACCLRLLATPGYDPTTVDDAGSSSILVATERNQRTIVVALVEKKAELNSVSTTKGDRAVVLGPALMLWSEEEDVQMCKLLIEAKADVNLRGGRNVDKEMSSSALLVWSKRHDVDMTRLLVAHGADVTFAHRFQEKGYRGTLLYQGPPLSLWCKSQQTQSRGYGQERTEADNAECISEEERLSIVSLLLSKGAHPDGQQDWVLQDQIEFLIESRAAEAKNKIEREKPFRDRQHVQIPKAVAKPLSPLATACSASWLSIARLLLKACRELKPTALQLTFRELAAEHQRQKDRASSRRQWKEDAGDEEDQANRVKEEPPTCVPDLFDTLCNAVRKGDEAVATFLLQEVEVRWNQSDHLLYPVDLISLAKDHEGMKTLLREAGVNGWTRLLRACKQGDLATATRILDDANDEDRERVTAPTIEGLCPLTLAVQSGNGKLLELLLDRGCSGRHIWQLGRYGHRHVALSVAVEEKQYDMAVLLASVTPPNVRVGKDQQPLLVNAIKVSSSMEREPVGDEPDPLEGLVMALVEAKADLRAADAQGQTCLHVACAHGRVKIIHLLIRLGAPLNCTALSGATPLMELARSDMAIKDMIVLEDALMEQGAVDWRSTQTYVDKLVRSPCQMEYLPKLKHLLLDMDHQRAKGWDWRTETLRRGRTLLEHACSHKESIELVKLLIELNASVQSDHKESALVLATKSGNEDAARFLLEHGASLEEPSEGSIKLMPRESPARVPGI